MEHRLTTTFQKARLSTKDGRTGSKWGQSPPYKTIKKHHTIQALAINDLQAIYACPSIFFSKRKKF